MTVRILHVVHTRTEKDSNLNQHADNLPSFMEFHLGFTRYFPLVVCDMDMNHECTDNYCLISLHVSAGRRFSIINIRIQIYKMVTLLCSAPLMSYCLRGEYVDNDVTEGIVFSKCHKLFLFQMSLDT